MIRRLVALVAALLGANASACPELDALVRRHGISFGGFMTPIPAVRLPAFSKTGRLLHLRLHTPAFVSDGFKHKIVFDTATRKAWILRTRGFAGVREWYGPVAADDVRLENCEAGADKVVAPLPGS